MEFRIIYNIMKWYNECGKGDNTFIENTNITIEITRDISSNGGIGKEKIWT